MYQQLRRHHYQQDCQQEHRHEIVLEWKHLEHVIEDEQHQQEPRHQPHYIHPDPIHNCIVFSFY